MFSEMISVCLVGFPAKYPVIVQTETYNIGESVQPELLPEYVVKRAAEGNINKVILYGNKELGNRMAELIKKLNDKLEIEVH